MLSALLRHLKMGPLALALFDDLGLFSARGGEPGTGVSVVPA
jgi:hypothetical protein